MYIVLASMSIKVTVFCPCTLLSILIFLFLKNIVEVVTELSAAVVTTPHFQEVIPAARPSKSVTEPPEVWLEVVDEVEGATDFVGDVVV